MPLRSPRSPHATPIRHHDRGITLVFGSDGQVSLIGFGGIASQPLGVSPTLAVGNTDVLTPSTQSLPNESTSISPIPNLEASSAPLTPTPSFPSTSTPATALSSFSSSNNSSSSTITDTDTNLPSIPTIDYPTPTPTAVSEPKDHGVGAPFYLAIVLASISFIGCVAAFIAWWIRSRARKRNFELDDPWHHRDSISDAGSTFTGNANEIEKGLQAPAESQTRPYYLPASIVRRNSSNLLAVPHTIPVLEEGTLQNGVSRSTLDSGRFPSFRRANENLSSRRNPRWDIHSSEATNLPSRPGMDHLQTGLSVQESTRTLGRLRVANRVPGDITSGDEGGTNLPPMPDSDSKRVSPPASYNVANPAPVGRNAVQETHADQINQSVEEGDALLEPPGPATLSWGRRIDTIPAFRRTRQRTPESSVQTYKNPLYSGYWYPVADARSIAPTRQILVATNGKEDGNSPTNPSPDPLCWTKTLKSSFWQAVDAMTGNRTPDSEIRAINAGSGSRFTPAPQRLVSRRSPASSARSIAVSGVTDTQTSLSQESEASSTETSGSRVTHFGGDIPDKVDSHPQRVSHLNRNIASTHQRHPDLLRTETGSVYSTDSAAARANLLKYGYADSIPSTWSALGASRESQLDLARTFLPLPRLISSSSPAPLSIVPPPFTLVSRLQSGSASARTRATMHSASDIIGSDASTLRSEKSADTNAASYGEVTTSSIHSLSRDGTIHSGRSAIGSTAPLPLPTTSSMLSRKKGVATRRRRPRPPPRALSTASSVQSAESGLSIKEAAVRMALLERRRKVKTAGSLRDRDDGPTCGRNENNPLEETTT